MKKKQREAQRRERRRTNIENRKANARNRSLPAVIEPETIYAQVVLPPPEPGLLSMFRALANLFRA